MLKPLDVEAELERLRIKCIIHLQREWRSRLAARAAKAEADKFLEIKRQQREVDWCEMKAEICVCVGGACALWRHSASFSNYVATLKLRPVPQISPACYLHR